MGTEIVWPKIPVVQDTQIIKDESAENASQLQAMNYRITGLENAIREQNILLQRVHQDRMHKDDLVKDLECSLSKHNLQLAKLLENLLSQQKSNERELQERIVASVNELLTSSLSENVQQVVAKEMKHISTGIHNLIDSYIHQLDTQYTQKLTVTDMMLKENISKAFNSKVSLKMWDYF